MAARATRRACRRSRLRLIAVEERKRSIAISDGEFGSRFGFRYQRAGHLTEEDIEEDVKLGDELAYLAAVTKSFELGEMRLGLLGETAYLRNFDGREDDALVVTGSAALETEPLTYIATYTQQVNLVAGGLDTREYLADFEVIYSSDDDTPFAGSDWQLGGCVFVREECGSGNRSHFLVCVQRSISAEAWTSTGRLAFCHGFASVEADAHGRLTVGFISR